MQARLLKLSLSLLVFASALFFACSGNDSSDSSQQSAASSSSIAVAVWPGNSSSGGSAAGDSGDNGDSSGYDGPVVNCLLDETCFTDAPEGECIAAGGTPVESCAPQPSSSSEAGASSSSGGESSPSSSSSSEESSYDPFPPPEAKSFTETVNGVSFDMVYIPGGTFTLGCEKTSGCPKDAAPVSGVKVSNYFIGKTEVSTTLYNAVMGITCSNTDYMCRGTGSATNITWYDAMEFACKLSELTGKNYRMTTEAEWEYAAKNHLNSLEKVGTGEEWAYNSWNSAHSGGTDPVGSGSGVYTQKTRRDAQETVDNITELTHQTPEFITGRLIRSIEGIGPALRLAISEEMAFPPNMVPACDIHAPKLEGGEPENSYRDPRWITGSNAKWSNGAIAIGTMDLMIWEDGTAKWKNLMGQSVSGQWFTSNNIALVLVPPNNGTRIKLAYIFLDEKQGSVISDNGFMNGGYIGRIEKKDTSGVTKPTVANLKSGADLAAEAGNDYKMIDMENIPQSARQQDPRLLDGPNQGWFQDNRTAGGVHHYRKDIDADEFRFTVNQGTSRTMLANGTWFTVNNTFLRVTHKDGYVAEYLYAVDSDGTFYHNSFMGYERSDFRMFKKTPNNGEVFAATCGTLCDSEIPKGEGASLYANMGETGKSTFVPAKCPAGGCK